MTNTFTLLDIAGLQVPPNLPEVEKRRIKAMARHPGAYNKETISVHAGAGAAFWEIEAKRICSECAIGPDCGDHQQYEMCEDIEMERNQHNLWLSVAEKASKP